MKKLNVGCGPKHIRSGWHNIDIFGFPGVDDVRDATLPFDDLAPVLCVYSEHFLEHLTIEDGIKFMRNCALALVEGGRLRISTPSLEWVMLTHFNARHSDPNSVISQTLGINRAFHGWGHQFLWSKPLIERAFRAVGFSEIVFCEPAKSSDPLLSGLEMHEGYDISGEFPSAWIIEGVREEILPNVDDSFISIVEREYTLYVRSGH